MKSEKIYLIEVTNLWGRHSTFIKAVFSGTNSKKMIRQKVFKIANANKNIHKWKNKILHVGYDQYRILTFTIIS